MATTLTAATPSLGLSGRICTFLSKHGSEGTKKYFGNKVNSLRNEIIEKAKTPPSTPAASSRVARFRERISEIRIPRFASASKIAPANSSPTAIVSQEPKPVEMEELVKTIASTPVDKRDDNSTSAATVITETAAPNSTLPQTPDERAEAARRIESSVKACITDTHAFIQSLREEAENLFRERANPTAPTTANSTLEPRIARRKETKPQPSLMEISSDNSEAIKTRQRNEYEKMSFEDLQAEYDALSRQYQDVTYILSNYKTKGFKIQESRLEELRDLELTMSVKIECATEVLRSPPFKVKILESRLRKANADNAALMEANETLRTENMVLKGSSSGHVPVAKKVDDLVVPRMGSTEPVVETVSGSSGLPLNAAESHEISLRGQSGQTVYNIDTTKIEDPVSFLSSFVRQIDADIQAGRPVRLIISGLDREQGYSTMVALQTQFQDFVGQSTRIEFKNGQLIVTQKGIPARALVSGIDRTMRSAVDLLSVAAAVFVNGAITRQALETAMLADRKSPNAPVVRARSEVLSDTIGFSLMAGISLFIAFQFEKEISPDALKTLGAGLMNLVRHIKDHGLEKVVENIQASDRMNAMVKGLGSILTSEQIKTIVQAIGEMALPNPNNPFEEQLRNYFQGIAAKVGFGPEQRKQFRSFFTIDSLKTIAGFVGYYLPHAGFGTRMGESLTRLMQRASSFDGAVERFVNDQLAPAIAGMPGSMVRSLGEMDLRAAGAVTLASALPLANTVRRIAMRKRQAVQSSTDIASGQGGMEDMFPTPTVDSRKKDEPNAASPTSTPPAGEKIDDFAPMSPKARANYLAEINKLNAAEEKEVDANLRAELLRSGGLVRSIK